mmetsp:Transcript_28014/g.58683  ORF Transcript_28014/g.58683 Transcript_28014/m.58683 type:complete len:1015 (+) Transcript_28014:281-3325(+)|eukprot:CAMPEP_0168178022 /NCGR_PEP_ID=MMETSP0139_2-20121125/8838_1 /TAXON_ID=44445 /ORGANISM="Pseudo-nitzschia australis, Strain 10249 10 AB" /LENGTH=1014 /DNA_ID=CAMNT_0008097257 /DNA_START=294 /DNA_END=3338 /DNA_ORIENTATION=+
MSSNNKSNDSNKVRVVGRIRPLAKYEIKNGSKPVVTKVPGFDTASGPDTLQIEDETNNNSGNSTRYYELDAVLDETSSQKDVYEKSGARKAIAEDLFCGYNATILAYGQTGSGKTFTMGTAQPTKDDTDGNDNNAGIDEQNDGVIPRACHDLFDTIRKKCDGQAKVQCSYMEVYNEEIRDLLVETNNGNNNNNTSKQDLRIRETLDGQIYVRGLTERVVTSPMDIYKIMEEANKRRVVASTKMNATSSRSHAICVLRIKGVVLLKDDNKNDDDGVSRTFEAKLTLVDLAGSERLGKTQATGKRAKEGISINKGLFVLGQVVSALAERGRILKQIEEQKHKSGGAGSPKKRKVLPPRKPPYRDSKLTRLLQDSLGGNSRTIMIACVSPADFNVEETVNTLRYATQARNISNTATANLVETIGQEEARKLKRENTLLKTQIAELEATIAKITQDVTPDDLERSMSILQHEQGQHSLQQQQLERAARRQSRRSVFAKTVEAIATIHTADELVDLPLEDNADHDFAYANQAAYDNDDNNDDENDNNENDNNKNNNEDDNNNEDENNNTENNSNDMSEQTIHQSNTSVPPEKKTVNVKRTSSLKDHFERARLSEDSESNYSDEDKDSVSLLVDDVMECRSAMGGSLRSTASISTVSMTMSMRRRQLHHGTAGGSNNIDFGSVTSEQIIEELEDENMELEARLLLAERDIKATALDSAVTLPALKLRVKQLEDDLLESRWLEDEAFTLQDQLNEERADKESAQRAAKQLADIMNRQKQVTAAEFQGSEDLWLERVNYSCHKLNEEWVQFVAVVLNFFKEEMRLLGDYFHMVLTVVDSPDILGMLGLLNNRDRNNLGNAGVGWWKSKEHKEKELEAAEAEKKLRKDLLKEHISFFNDRLVEIEEEVNLRSESVDAILETLSDERGILEVEFESEEELNAVRDIFSKKGESLLKQLTALITNKKRADTSKEKEGAVPGAVPVTKNPDEDELSSDKDELSFNEDSDEELLDEDDMTGDVTVKC